jgi:hypothetical protein
MIRRAVPPFPTILDNVLPGKSNAGLFSYSCRDCLLHSPVHEKVRLRYVFHGHILESRMRQGEENG